MKRIQYLLAACLVFIFVGCPVRSIFPLITVHEHVFDPALVGTWVEEGRDTLTITASTDKYTARSPVGRDGSTVRYHHYDVLRGRLDKYWFLDTYQVIRDDEQDHLIPTHSFHRYWLNGDTLTLATCDVNWLAKMIDGNQVTLTHVRREGEIIVTASTQELQAFVVRYADDPAAFIRSGTFVRVR